jgi:hypothetical protein
MSRGVADGGAGARIGGCAGGCPRSGFTPSSDHAGALTSSAATQVVVTHDGEKSERRTDGQRCIVRSCMQNLGFRLVSFGRRGRGRAGSQSEACRRNLIPSSSS